MVRTTQLTIVLLALAACSCEKVNSMDSAPSTTTASSSGKLLLSASIRLSWGDGGPVRPGELPVPVNCKTGLCLAAFELSAPPWLPSHPRAENERAANEVSIPMRVVYVDARSGEMVDATGPGYDLFNVSAPKHFGIPNPPDRIVGHFDDPTWLPKERRQLLRDRILAALDVLLPLFTEQTRPWTEEANKAAQQVRDYCPLVAEPGLWPYYKAEGREFFAWVEKNAPPGNAPLPWEQPSR